MKTKSGKRVRTAKGKSLKTVKIRRFWTINPKIRVKESAKIYSRRRAKTELERLLEGVIDE